MTDVVLLKNQRCNHLEHTIVLYPPPCTLHFTCSTPVEPTRTPARYKKEKRMRKDNTLKFSAHFTRMIKSHSVSELSHSAREDEELKYLKEALSLSLPSSIGPVLGGKAGELPKGMGVRSRSLSTFEDDRVGRNPDGSRETFLALPVGSNRASRSNSSDSAVVLPSSEDEKSPSSDDRISPILRRMSDLTDYSSIATQSTRSSVSSMATCMLRAPSVIISDYSNVEGEEDSLEGRDDFTVDRNHPYAGDDFKLNAWLLAPASRRRTSNASTCSSISTLSEDCEEYEEAGQQLVVTSNKPSGWRIVRNAVHWSPFVQTYKKQRYPWIQLAGHQGSFKAGDQGTILKKLCSREERCLQRLMGDSLRPFVPEYKGLYENDDGEKYIRLQDLLGEFENPSVMDLKVGQRTYLEEELAKATEKPKLRKDMYEKMVQVDVNAPTDEEHRLKGVSKPRYMVWRETISSTESLGFRIEGVKYSSGSSSKDFKTTKSKSQVSDVIRTFVQDNPSTLPLYLQRLRDLERTLAQSDFFKKHELIGTSLLFVHDAHNAGMWMIDFAKTMSLPETIKIDHRKPWHVGNHEDGYLLGVESLIDIFGALVSEKEAESDFKSLSVEDSL